MLKSDPYKAKPKQPVEPSPSCSPRVPDPFHELRLRFGRALPAKLAVEVDGARKRDDCGTVRDQLPEVAVLREGVGQVLVRVEHGDFFRSPPREIQVRIFGREQCDLPEQLAFDGPRHPLFFQEEFPNGRKCPGHQVARAEHFTP